MKIFKWIKDFINGNKHITIELTPLLFICIYSDWGVRTPAKRLKNGSWGHGKQFYKRSLYTGGELPRLYTFIGPVVIDQVLTWEQANHTTLLERAAQTTGRGICVKCETVAHLSGNNLCPACVGNWIKEYRSLHKRRS